MKECFNGSEPRGGGEVAGILAISTVALFNHSNESLPLSTYGESASSDIRQSVQLFCA